MFGRSRKLPSNGLRNPVNTTAVKTPKSLPLPTKEILQKFDLGWNFEQATGSTWGNTHSESFEFMVPGTHNGTNYLFLTKGTSYGRSYYIFKNEDKKPLYRVLNHIELSLVLTTLKTRSRADLVSYLLHPSARLRALAEKLAKEIKDATI